jgi:hypothetical protein
MRAAESGEAGSRGREGGLLLLLSAGDEKPAHQLVFFALPNLDRDRDRDRDRDAQAPVF